MMYSNISTRDSKISLNRIILVVCFLVGGLSASHLTAQTVGFVSSDEILSRFPQAVDARIKLGEMQGKWVQEIRDTELKINALRAEIERNRLLWSAQEKAKKEGELKDLEANVSTLRSKTFGPNGQYETEYKRLMTPVIEIVMVAVQAEADAQDYDFVFDKSSRGLPLLVANPDHDLTFAVLKRLGVEIDPADLEARSSKPLQILPESFPVQIQSDGSPIQLNGNTSRNGNESRPIDPNALNKSIEVQQSLQVTPIKPNEEVKEDE